MGTIAQKLTYLEDTKTRIGNAITAKGGSVTGKTFRQYATEIENLPSGGGGTPIAESVDVSDYTGGTDFNFLAQITDVNWPSGITSIDNACFSNLKGITSLIIPNGVTSLGQNSISNCTGLTSVTLPNSLTNIGGYAFSSDLNLVSIAIPDSVTSIGQYAFSYCSGLTTVTIGSGVTSLGYYAFSNCNHLTAVNVSDLASWCSISFNNGESNPLYNAHHLYQNGNEITNLVIPNTVTEISNSAFIQCRGFISITIPDSVSTIGNSAFSDCLSLTTVTIGSGVTSIGGVAFYNCNSLNSITINATTPPTLGSNTFSKTNNCPIYVPAASVDTYKAASQWSSLASRIQAIPTE